MPQTAQGFSLKTPGLMKIVEIHFFADLRKGFILIIPGMNNLFLERI